MCFSLSTTEKELFRRLNLHEPRNVTRKERNKRRETTGKRKERSGPILKEIVRLGATTKKGPSFRGERKGQKEEKNKA